MSVSYVVVAARIPRLALAADVAGRGGDLVIFTCDEWSYLLHRADHPEGRTLVVFTTGRDGDRERHDRFALQLGCWLEEHGACWQWAFEHEPWSSQPPGMPTTG